jgi:hypothetical protein
MRIQNKKDPGVVGQLLILAIFAIVVGPALIPGL